ncbi:recombinase family protein [Sabulibacter ruber]|uniref:recombinase family protein n=1 Tax=Sabulibacter ruber TaxID=2811901 RepID=UPI001A9596E3|nr:recombinase family protein [Sabulibacter ruber]
MNKVALLVRVSSADQKQERQITELTTYAEAKGYKIVETICETISGSKTNTERKAIQTLLELARTGKVNKVLVHEVSRLGRATPEVLATLEELHSYKVSIVVMNYNLETLNPNGSLNSMAQFLVTILADIGRMERLTLIERVKSGMAEAKRQGKHIGRKKGSVKATDKMLLEYKKVVKCLNEGHTVRDTAKICEIGISTVQRVKNKMKELEQEAKG